LAALVGPLAVVLSGSWWNPASWLEDAVNAIVSKLADGIIWLLDVALNNSFTLLSEGEWTAVFGQAGRWGAIFAVVAVCLCAVEIISGMIARDSARVVRGWLYAVAAWPLTVASLLIFQQLVNVSNALSTTILRTSTSTAGTAQALVGGATIAALGAMLTAIAISGSISWPVILGGLGICLFGVLLLALVFAAVAFAQMCVAGFAPVALMLVGFRGTRPMSAKWAQFAATLLLAKPIAAGIISLCIAVAAAPSDNTGDQMASFLTGFVGIGVAIFSPALAYSFLGFTGAQLGGAFTAFHDKAKSATPGVSTFAGFFGGSGGKSSSPSSTLAKESSDSTSAQAEAAATSAPDGTPTPVSAQPDDADDSTATPPAESSTPDAGHTGDAHPTTPPTAQSADAPDTDEEAEESRGTSPAVDAARTDLPAQQESAQDSAQGDGAQQPGRQHGADQAAASEPAGTAAEGSAPAPDGGSAPSSPAPASGPATSSGAPDTSSPEPDHESALRGGIDGADPPAAPAPPSTPYIPNLGPNPDGADLFRGGNQ
jgi:hypothetical protein